MTHLTYWYGCYHDLQSAYSFQKTNKLISYEAGYKSIEKKLIVLRRKLSEGKKLARKDADLLKGMEEMELDLKKHPGERSGYVGFDFPEEYHLLLEEEVVVEQDEPQKKQKLIKDKPKKKKTKKKKKLTQPDNQIMTTGEAETEEFVENGEKLKTKKVIKKRKKKDKNLTDPSRPKKKVKTSADDTNPVAKSTTANLFGDEGASDENGTAIVEDARPSAYEEFQALGDESSHGGTDDENMKIDDIESENDSEDEDYMEKWKSNATKKKKLKKEKKLAMSKEPVKKKAAKIKSEKGNSLKTLKREKNNRAKKEQERFRSCEKKFLQLVRRWEIATSNKDANQLSRIFDELLVNMKHFTAPFIEEYGMSDLMKQSKKIGDDKDKFKQVMTEFKKVYTEKKDAVPEGFKAIKESEMKGSSIDEKTEIAIDESKRTKTPAVQPKLEEDAKKMDQDKPMERIPKSIKQSRHCASDGNTKTPLKLEPVSQKKQQSTARADKKKRFSLTKLIRPVIASSQPGLVGDDLPSSSGGEPSAISSQSSKQNQAIPSWTLQAMSTETPSNENRLFGLEFLQQATLCIPESKNVNRSATVHNLELAIYNWSTGDSNEGKKHQGIGKNKNLDNDSADFWVDKYWSKIHDLVACISGKRLKGTLVGMIAAGKFATPDKLICLSDDDLWRSFQSSPMSEI
jgi:hypothetical protein